MHCTVMSHDLESLQFSTGTLTLILIASPTPSLDSLPRRACNVVHFMYVGNLKTHILGNTLHDTVLKRYPTAPKNFRNLLFVAGLSICTAAVTLSRDQCLAAAN